MTVFKRADSGIWQIKFKYRGEDYRRSSGTEDKNEAKRQEVNWRKELYEQKVNGVLPVMTLREAIQKYYLGTVEPGQENNLAKTKKAAESIIDGFIRDLPVDKPVTEITKEVVADYQLKLLKEGSTRANGKGGRGNKPGTVDRRMSILISILNECKTLWGTLKEVPSIKKYAEKDERTRCLSDVEEVRLLAAFDTMKNQDAKDVTILLLDTGCRRGDALQLEWPQVMFDRQPRPMVSYLKTKTDSARSVPLTPRAEEVLRRRYETRRDKKGPFPYEPNQTTHELGRKGRRGRQSLKDGRPSLRVAFRRALALAEIKGFTIHSCRHTFASRLAAAGVSLAKIGKMLGHSGPRMTQRYAHLAPEDLDASIDVLARRSAGVEQSVAKAPVD